jgi:hypothetical protein
MDGGGVDSGDDLENCGDIRWTFEDGITAIKEWLLNHQRGSWTIRTTGPCPTKGTNGGWGIEQDRDRDEFYQKIDQMMTYDIEDAEDDDNQLYLCHAHAPGDPSELRIWIGYEARDQ